MRPRKTTTGRSSRCPNGWVHGTQPPIGPLALREAIGRFSGRGAELLLLKLVTDTFRTSSSTGSCLEASVRHVYMSAQAPDLKDNVVAKLVDERHAAWEADLPLGDDAALWDYLSVLDQGSRLAHSGALPQLWDQRAP